MSALSYIQGQPMKMSVNPNGNVGIGTIVADHRLHVAGDVFSTGTLIASNLLILGEFTFYNRVTSNIDPYIIDNFKPGPALKVIQSGIGLSNSVAEFYGVNKDISLYISDTGNVGIGTKVPNYNMHIHGNMFANTLTGSNLYMLGNPSIFLSTSCNLERVIIRTSNTQPSLLVTQMGEGPVVDVQTSEGIAVRVGSNGFVGIGTTNPSQHLHVHGNILCSNIFGNASNVLGLAPSAKIDTTDAANISQGTISKDRLPGIQNVTTFRGVGIGTAIPTGAFEAIGSMTMRPYAFPPAPLTGNSTDIFDNVLTLINGTYTCAASVNSPFLSFDDDTSSGWTSCNVYIPNYTDVLGSFVTRDIANVDYSGHWIQLGLPFNIALYSYTLTPPPLLVNAPSSWVVLGSYDGNSDNSWNVVHRVSNYVWTAFNLESHTFLVNSPIVYNFYRIVVLRNQQSSGAYTFTSINNWKLFGNSQGIYSGLTLQGPLRIQGTGPANTINVIADASNVGIGTNSPLDRLHVNGGLLVQGPVRFQLNGTNSNNFIISSSNVGISTNAPFDTLHLGSGNLRISSLAGVGTRSLSVDQNGVLTLSVSDEVYKTDFEPLRYGLPEIMLLQPLHFAWKDKQRFGHQNEIGLIAQQVQPIIPESVSRDLDDGMYYMDYVKLIPVLIQSIKQLSTELDMVKKTLANMSS